MKVIGLVSGGKDSCFNLVECVAAGHEIVALANLRPENQTKEELDSMMYQTVGSSAVEYIAKAMNLPFFIGTTTGEGRSTNRDYTPTQGDEVEDLYQLLSRVIKETGAEAVSVGAILSDYQRVRVENVCLRLSVVPLSYLWQRDQVELLHEMIECGMKSVLIKVACLGLNSSHLGLTLGQMEDKLLVLKDKYGVNVCGEGGEYETFTLDCPLFRQGLEITTQTCIKHSEDPFSPVSYLHLEVKLVDKSIPNTLTQPQLLAHHKLKDLSPHRFLSDIISVYVEDTENLPEPVVCGVVSDEPEVRLNHPEKDWIEIINIPGVGTTPAQGISSAFSVLAERLKESGATLSCLSRIILYVSSMSDYGEINKVYQEQFGLNPPVRVCVAVGADNLPKGCLLSMSARGWIGSEELRCMHVQGLSHWAPANIGPYSQCSMAGNLLHVSGQIALIPGSMTLIPEPDKEPDLAYRHVLRAMSGLEPRVSESDICSAVCYVVSPECSRKVQSYWLSRNMKIDLDVLLVSQLPRSANYEWEIVIRLPKQDL